MTTTPVCESCAVAGIDTPATTHSRNPDWSGYALCADCAAEYDARPALQSPDDDPQGDTP